MPRIALLLASATLLLASISSVLAADRTTAAVPFTLTETGEPPTSTPVAPTATSVPHGATPVPPTATALPGATDTPVSTPGKDKNKKETDEATATPVSACGTCPKIYQRTVNVYTYIDLPILAWPGDCNEVVFTLPARSRVTAIAGPARADGKVWWKIRTAPNQAGHVQEGWVDESTHINFY